MQVFWVDVVGLIFEIDYSLIGLKSLTIQLAFNEALLTLEALVTVKYPSNNKDRTGGICYSPGPLVIRIIEFLQGKIGKIVIGTGIGASTDTPLR